MNVYEEYQKKLVTPQEAVKLVKDGDWVDFSQTCSFPEALDEALAQRRDELRDVKIRCAISMKPSPTTSGTVPAWTGSIWTGGWPSTPPCSSGTAGPTTGGATPR